MMDLDLEICAYALRTSDIGGLLRNGVRPELLDAASDGKMIFEKILDFHRKYGGRMPSQNAFAEETGLDLKRLDGKGLECLDYYLDKLEARQLTNVIQGGFKSLKEPIVNGDPRQALANLKELARQASSSWRVSGPVVTMDDLADERIAEYEAAERAQGGITGWRTPWPILNESTGGLKGGDYFIWAGKRGLGKSWILCLLANEFAKQGARVLIISMEMPNLAIQKRLTCIRGRFRPKDVKLGRLNQAKDRYIEFEKTAWKSDQLFFSPDGVVRSLADFDTVVQDTNPQIVLLDGIYLVDQGFGKKGEDIWQRVARVSYHLRHTALRNGILVGGTCQFNKTLKLKSLKADLDKVAHADALTFDATHAWGMVQDGTLAQLNRMRNICMKNREGEEDHFDIMWDIPSTNFEEVGRPKDLEDDYKTDENGDVCKADEVPY